MIKTLSEIYGNSAALPAVIVKPAPAPEPPRKIISAIDWEVIERPLYDYRGREVKTHKSLVNSENEDVISIVGKDYQVIPNKLFSEITEEMANVTKYEFTGFQSLKKSGIVLARFLSEPFQIAGHDFRSYMVMGNSHNGSSSFFVGENNTMTRCDNQYSSIGNAARLRHTKNVRSNIAIVPAIFNNYLKRKQVVIEMLQKMEKIPIGIQQVKTLINSLQNVDAETVKKQRQTVILEDCIKRETKALGMNAFGVFNGVTFWTTHEKYSKDPVYSQLFGTKAQAQKKAIRILNNFETEIVDVTDYEYM